MLALVEVLEGGSTGVLTEATAGILWAIQRESEMELAPLQSVLSIIPFCLWELQEVVT